MKNNMFYLLLLTSHLVGMFNSDKTYFFGITDISQIPKNGQAILDKNDRLVAYHVKKEEGNLITFELYDLHKKIVVTKSIQGDKKVSYPLIYPLNITVQEQQLLAAWSAAISSLFCYTSSPDLPLSPLLKSMADHDILHHPERPLKIDYELHDTRWFFTTTVQKCKDLLGWH